MATSCLEYDELEKAMRGQSTLSGFDVLVSYSQPELNHVLHNAARADTDSSIDIPEFIAEGTGLCESTNRSVC